MGTGTLDRAAGSARWLAAVDLEALSDDELHAVVVELGELSTRLEAQWCRAIACWDARMVWADNGSAVRRPPACRVRPAAARAAVAGW